MEIKDTATDHTSSTAPTSVTSDKPQATSRSRESTHSNYAASNSSSGASRGRTRTRSDLSNPLSSANLEKRGYHTFTCLGKDFHVDKRWKLVRELGQGAYGIVVLAQDTISGENVAIKLVTRVFDKKELAKRALREIALLRHFNNHENITGLIDMDLLSPDFNEIYLFMEPMEADLHQIIRSGQVLTNAHVQYFLYQILRGCKYIHSADVVHRDLKPGNLLVNADCELKICDLGLSRGFERGVDDESVTHMTEYVATRWYRAPEIMLSFRRYGTAIDVWSIGCILGELLGGKPMFKGKDYVDQLNIILRVLGTPSESTIKRIGSEKAQAYIRSLPVKHKVAFQTLFPTADPLALDLLGRMLAFDPADRITVLQALEHPYLESYHEIGDEPECPTKFDKWREIEEIESDFDYRKAIWREVYEFRLDVRTLDVEGMAAEDTVRDNEEETEDALQDEVEGNEDEVPEASDTLEPPPHPRESSLELPEAHRHEAPVSPVTFLASVPEDAAVDTSVLPGKEVPGDGVIPNDTSIAPIPFPTTEDNYDFTKPIPRPHGRSSSSASTTSTLRPSSGTVDPYTTYARRSSLLFTTYTPAQQQQLAQGASLAGGGVPEGTGYIVPMRSRAPSTEGGELRPLLRTLSTGGLGTLMEKKTAAGITQADLPPSALPTAFKSASEKSAGVSDKVVDE